MALQHKKRTIILGAIATVIVALIIAAAVYLNTYYPAGRAAKESLQSDAAVSVRTCDDGDIVFEPADHQAANGAGLIFYPGAKVEYIAYAPLMHALSERGFTCVLVKMPFNMAFFDVDAADAARELAPDVTRWYVGGHSLGGAMAAKYLAGHADEYAGLLLCASYATEDLSADNLAVLSAYGTQDGVLNRDSYQSNWKNLPSNAQELVIDGGNHAQFGDYGAQDGDGEASIAPAEQIAKTADAFAQLDGHVLQEHQYGN
jgi:pimeloyl-ACP methyl ester carboxylesterase